MAVAADGQPLQHHRGRFLRINSPEAPTNAGRVLHRVQKRQVHFPIKQGRAHLVFGSAKGDLATRQKVERCRALETKHCHLSPLPTRALFDLLPFLRLGRPIPPLTDKAKSAIIARETLPRPAKCPPWLHPATQRCKERSQEGTVCYCADNETSIRDSPGFPDNPPGSVRLANAVRMKFPGTPMLEGQKLSRACKSNWSRACA